MKNKIRITKLNYAVCHLCLIIFILKKLQENILQENKSAEQIKISSTNILIYALSHGKVLGSTGPTK